MASISPELASELRAKIDSYTLKPHGVPGLVYTIINKNGTRLLNHASGKRGAGIEQPMTTDTVFWIASCTKLITSIAAMQLVESKILALEDSEQIEKITPELKKVQVLEEGPDGSLKLVDKKRKITLRMLLNHTAGFSYSFLSPKLKRWSEPIGVAEYSCHTFDLFDQPLVNQPGEAWAYGTNLDWVGRIVERVSGLSLDDYFRKSIFTPLGIQNIGFFPSAAMKQNIAYINDRAPDGTISLRQDAHLYRLPLIAQTQEDRDRIVNSGGAGCFSGNTEYCEILAALLNNGLHQKTGARILQKGTVDEMFKNQIPEFPNFGRSKALAAKPYLTNSGSDIYPQPHDQPQGWGLSFFSQIHHGPTGRSAGSGFWSGLANLVWWIDRERGVAGLVSSQILPFGDQDLWTCQEEVEKMFYDGLSS